MSNKERIPMEELNARILAAAIVIWMFILAIGGCN